MARIRNVVIGFSRSEKNNHPPNLEMTESDNGNATTTECRAEHESIFFDPDWTGIPTGPGMSGTQSHGPNRIARLRQAGP